MTTKKQTRDSNMSAITVVEFERKTLPSETYLSELGDGGPPFTISGVALGAGDVTKGKSGIKKKWPAEELKQAAETLQGTSLVVNHENTAEGVVGRVTKAGYKDGTGVVYEGELHDEELAEKIKNGLLEVSVRGLHADVENLEEDEETGATLVEDIEFKNLSIVPSGAAPSNTLSMGEHTELSEAELAAFTDTLETAELQEIEPGMWVTTGDTNGITISQVQDGEIEVDIYEERDGQWRSTEQTEMFDVDSLDEWDVDEDDIGPAQDEEKDSESSDEEENAENLSEGDYVSWDSSGGRAFGQIQSVRTSEDITNDEIKGEGGPITAEEDDPAVLIEVWQNGEASDTMVGHKMSSLDKVEKGTVEEEATAISDGQFVKWKDAGDETRFGQVIGIGQEGNQFVATLRRFTKSGDKLDETAEKPVQRLDMWDDASLAEDDETDSEPTESRSADSESMRFSEGQTVQWRAMGRVAHNPENQDIVMVELMLEEDGEMESTGFTASIPTEALQLTDSAEENTLMTADVPVEDAHPSHDAMGNSLVEEFIEEHSSDATIGQFAQWLEQAELSDRVEGEDKRYHSKKEIKEARADDFTFIEDDPEELAESFDDYPEAAQENAQMALDAREETDNPNDCGTDVGWKRANQLANGESLTREQLGKMSAFARHEGNSEMDDDEGKADCGWMMWKAWGGDEGVEWAQRKLDQLEEEASADEGDTSDAGAELQDYEMHEPSWDGTTEQDWSSPDMEDFDTDDLGEIADHFIISSSGFPPENFGDLKLPIVEPSGELNVNALAAVKGGRGASAVDGLSSDMEDEIDSMVNSLANEHFDRNWGNDEEQNMEEMADVNVPEDHRFSSKEDAMSFVEDTDGLFGVHKMEFDGETMWVPGADHDEYVDVVGSASKHGDMDDEDDEEMASIDRTAGEPTGPTKSVGSGVRVLPGDDLRHELTGASEQDSLQQYKVINMNEQIEEKLSELEDPVAVEAEELQELQDKADRFEELSENIEAIRERTEILDEVDRDSVEELRDSDDPVVVESARFEGLQDEAEQVKSVYAASLAEHTPGFDAEELAEAHDIDTLREKHEDVVGELEEELSSSSEDAEPRSQDPSEEELEDASDEGQAEEELGDEVQQKQEEILGKIKDGRL